MATSNPAKPLHTLSFVQAGRSFRDIRNGGLPLLCCALYIAVHFIPNLGGYDVMSVQWFYLALLDFIVAVFILINKGDYKAGARRVFSNRFTHSYLALALLAGLSFFAAINKTEMLVCYVRLVATVIAFLNLSVLLNGRIYLFHLIAQVVSIVLLVESLYALYTFFQGISTVRLDMLILSLKGNTGNKNIFAASLVVKIPFTLYCIYSQKITGRVINLSALFLGILTIFIVNARSSYVGLLLITGIYIAFCLFTFWKYKRKELLLYRTGYLLLPLLIAFFSSNMILSSAQSFQDEKGGYGTVAERFGTIGFTNDASSYRFALWKHAVDYSKHHPLMGCGYGNWKLASIPYEKEYIDDMNVPAHSHNDFLETSAELGLPGGLLLLALFVILVVYTIRTLRSSSDDHVKLAAVFSSLALAGYFVDAVLNFPGERPVMQLFFALIAALNVAAFNQSSERAASSLVPATAPPHDNNAIAPSTSYALITILTLLPIINVTFLTYQSSRAQLLVTPDLENETLQLPLNQVRNIFPPIPNLTSTGQPIDAIVGRYFYENKQYDRAIQLFDKGSKANPYLFFSDFMKADVYYVTDQVDSAYKYASQAYYNRPRAKTYYQTLIAVCAKKKDTAAIRKAFLTYTKYRNQPFGWNMYLMGTLNVLKKGTNELLSMADSALHLFPQDPDILTRRQEIVNSMGIPVNGFQVPANVQATYQQLQAAGRDAFGKGDYNNAAIYFIKAANISSEDYSNFENAAISYFNMKEYAKSIVYFDKVIGMKKAVDGKSEFFKGVALLNLGRKAEGCALLQVSKTKGYQAAEGIIRSNCGQ
jgi:O-antigen ligase/tetratricopeptide (TPR) repeat protein